MGALIGSLCGQIIGDIFFIGFDCQIIWGLSIDCSSIHIQTLFNQQLNDR